MLFLKTKEKENDILHLGPWNDLGLADRPLAGARNRGGGGGPFPGKGARRRRGEVGEELEDIEFHPKVVLDGVGRRG